MDQITVVQLISFLYKPQGSPGIVRQNIKEIEETIASLTKEFLVAILNNFTRR